MMLSLRLELDFSQVDWGEAGNNTVNVIVPEIKVLSKELKKDSFKVYHEEESIFTNVTLEENNKALTKFRRYCVEGCN